MKVSEILLQLLIDNMWAFQEVSLEGDPYETLCRVKSLILIIRLVVLACNKTKNVWVGGPSSRKGQWCGSQP
jgi:hypothetical protein